jgi:hypothetical protein
MKRIRSAILLTSVALSLGVWQGVAAATTSTARTTPTNVTWTEEGPYDCVGPCATATYYFAWGMAHADSKDFGTMKGSMSGTVLDYNPVTNCLDQSENWVFTTQKGDDAIYLTTTSDTLCFTADPNVSIENGAFTITGGTGRFTGATGSGTFQLTVLTHPQKGSGTFTATITY